uniref:hypothetical protein n=1 Tax=Kitasatospora sp. MY 5-36 TaxID=1678027 RepID=UPI000670B487
SDFGADPEARRVGAALRIAAEAGQLLSIWRHSPLQVLARLHLLAVGDGDPAAGRPRRAGEGAELLFPQELEPVESVEVEAVDGPPPVLPPAPGAEEVAARLDQLSRLLVARAEGQGVGTPALVVASVVHGELLALRPFGAHNGVIARAAQRIVLIAEGLDPKSICPAEVGLAELGTAAHRRALAGYLAGTPEGMAAWIAYSGRALRLGVRESTAVCEAMQRGMV